jgi:hypothetical protein
VSRYALDSSGSGQGLVAASCLCGKESSGPIRSGKDFLSTLAITGSSRTQFHVVNYMRILFLIFGILFYKINVQERYDCDVHIKAYQLLCCCDLWTCFFSSLRHV